MAEATEITGATFKGKERMVRIEPVQPGRVSVSVFVGEKQVSVEVTTNELIQAIRRADPDQQT
jgi:hypothetical protein